MVIISCAFPECPFQTEDLDGNIASAVLQSHTFCHAFTPLAHRADAAVAPKGPRHHGSKLDRPHIDIGVSLEEWNLFTRRSDVFKQGSALDDFQTSCFNALFRR